MVFLYMNEADPRAELIDSALKVAGWGVVEGSRIARELHITKGRLPGAGVRAKAEIADYVLTYRERRLAVVEAKRRLRILFLACRNILANQAFIDFVLNQYVESGVEELDVARLLELLTLKYHAVADAVSELGDVASIRQVFAGFQKDLYSDEETA